MRARCSEKAAECDVRIPEKRPGAGLMYVLCTIYGRHERRRSRTREATFELKQREHSKRASNYSWCGVAAWRRIAVASRRRTNGACESFQVLTKTCQTEI